MSVNKKLLVALFVWFGSFYIMQLGVSAFKLDPHTSIIAAIALACAGSLAVFMWR